MRVRISCVVLEVNKSSNRCFHPTLANLRLKLILRMQTCVYNSSFACKPEFITLPSQCKPAFITDPAHTKLRL